MHSELRPVSPLPVHLKSFVTDCLNEIKPNTNSCLGLLKAKAVEVPPLSKRKVGSGFLTAREFQCVNVLIQKKFYHEVAAELGLSKRTVEFYINNIKKKYNLLSKKSLICYFKDYGLGQD